MEAEVRKWGGSKAVILPEILASRLEIEIGDRVEIDVIKKGKTSGFGKFPSSKPFIRDESDLERHF